ncbi:MAG: hypothetical protein JOS17DRAFT_754370 [Linnemannia elongata]|nr:MAG: hypothetical protein JOS17DRAFT_754370 [Linnemannia elongata]
MSWNEEVVCLLLCCKFDLLLCRCPDEREGETVSKESKRDGKWRILSLAVVIRKPRDGGVEFGCCLLQLWSWLRSVCVVGARCSSCWLWLQSGTEER